MTNTQEDHMTGRYRTREQRHRDERAFWAAKDRKADLHRDWKVGDAVMPFDGLTPTTIAQRAGDTVMLANGQGGHVNNLRTPGTVGC